MPLRPWIGMISVLATPIRSMYSVRLGIAAALTSSTDGAACSSGLPDFMTLAADPWSPWISTTSFSSCWISATAAGSLS